MFGYFTPDVIYNNVYDIDYDLLKEKNIKGLIFDIDNTLVSYKQKKPTENVIALMNKLKSEGFVICFISNNSKERVDIFNEKFRFYSFPKAKKPSVKFIKEALKKMDLNNKKVALIGDQLFTDVTAAKRAKMTALLVSPIEPVETLFFKFKRFMEKPFIRRYYRRLKKSYGKKYKFALLGTPVEHSLSPEIHKIFAEGCGLDKNFEYIKIDTDKSQLKNKIDYLKQESFSGFNCTMPLKEEIIKYIDYKSPQVLFLNSCNTVKIDKKNILCGYTTDGAGMIEGIKYNGVEIKNKNILVLGAGGTAKSVVLSLITEQAKNIIVLNRSKENLDIIKNLFVKYKNNIKFDLLNLINTEKYIKEFDIDILINASRLGMKGFEESPEFDCEYKFLSLMKNSVVIVDSVYNPLKTKLVTAAENSGFKIVDGFWMLVYQGAFAFEYWTGKKVPEEYIKKAHGIIKRP